MEEVAESDEGSNGLDVSWWFHIFDGLKFVFSWLDSFRH
jgi:hypothetical protein